MAEGEKILAAAAREIGCHEKSGKRTKYGEWYGLQGKPWCMEFVQWVYHEAGIDLPFKTASCGELLRWYREHQPECVVKEPVPGCIVIFDFPGTAYSTDHTGLFVKLTEVSRGEKIITTIDGNTSSGNNSNGGWVQQRSRSLSYANPTYIIPRELTAQAKRKQHTETEDEDVKRFNTMAEINKEAPWASETVMKLIAHGTIKGSGATDVLGRPADMDISEDMLRVLEWNDREGLYK